MAKFAMVWAVLAAWLIPLAAAAAAEDRHAGYYYPPPATIETYAARTIVLRQGQIAGIRSLDETDPEEVAALITGDTVRPRARDPERDSPKENL